MQKVNPPKCVVFRTMFNKLVFLAVTVLFPLQLSAQLPLLDDAKHLKNENTEPQPLSVPNLIFPVDGAWLNSMLVIFQWSSGKSSALEHNSMASSSARYILEISKSISFVEPIIVDTTISTYVYKVLYEGRYYWRVKAFDQGGNKSEFSSPDSFGVDITYPREPIPVSPIDGSIVLSSTPEFVWKSAADNLSGVDHYILQYADHPNLNYGAISKLVRDTIYIPPPLPDTTYYWRVMAVDKANNKGCWTARWTFTITTAGCPDIPTLLYPADSSRINDVTPTFIWTSEGGPGVVYSLHYALDEIFQQGLVTVDGISDTVYTVTDSLLDTTYYWRVEAINPFGCHSGWPSPFTFTIDTILPSIPTLISPADSSLVNDNTPTFIWTHTVSAGGHYTLQYALDSSFSQDVVTIYDIIDTSYTISDTLADTIYYWHVEAIDYTGNHSGYQSHPFMFTVYTKLPQIPLLISPEDSSFTNDDTPTFVWSAVSGMGITYTLQYSMDSNFVTNVVKVFDIADTSYTIPGALALKDTTYYWRVEAVDHADNHSGYQPHPFMFTIDTELPDIPVLIAPGDSSLINDNTPTFIWSSTARPAGSHKSQYALSSSFSYALQYALNSSFTQGVVTITDIHDTSYTALDTLEENTYYWRVETIDPAGNHSGYQPHPFMFTIDTGPPEIPVLMRPSDNARINDRTPKFEWSSTAGLNGSYTLQYSMTEDFYPWATNTIGNVTNTYHTLHDTLELSDGNYYWRVEAIDQAGNHSGYQPDPFMFTIDTWPPNKPVLIAPPCDTTITSNTVQFVWSSVIDCAKYVLQYALNNTFTLGVVTITNIPDTTLTRTIPDGIYYWRVEAVDYANNHSGYTAPCKLTIDTQGPCPPTLISPDDFSVINDSTPKFVWTPTAGSGGTYTLEWALDSLFTQSVTTVESIPYDQNDYTVAIALAETTWYWHVEAIDYVGNHSGYQKHPFKFTIDTGMPDQPVLIAPPNDTVTNNSIPIFVWSSTVGPGGHYKLQYAKNNTFSQDVVTISNIRDTVDTVQNVLDDGVYYWHVEAIDEADNHSGYQSPFKFTIDTEAPCPPTLLSPCDALINDSTPTFVWALNLGPGEGTYTLQYARDSMFTLDVVTVSGIDSNTYVVPDTQALSDGTWYWHVEAIDQAGNQSGYSLWCVFHIFTELPDIPILIEPRDDTTFAENIVQFIWSSTAGPDGSYILEYALNDAFIDGVATIFTAETTYVDTLPLDTTYYWHVDAVNQAGSHSGYQPHPFKFTIGVIEPYAPIVSIITFEKDKLRLDWTDAEVDSYNLYRDTIPCFMPNTPIETGITDTFYIDSMPGVVGNPDVNYFYYVTGLRKNVESGPSNQVGEFDFQLNTTGQDTTNWNNVALCLALSTVDSASNLMNVVPTCSSVARWNANLQTFDQYLPGVPGAPDFEVLPGYPYYVYVTKDTVWTLTGAMTSPIFNLITTGPDTTNWNEIAVPICETTIDSASKLMDAVPACSSVARWNAALQTYDQYLPGVPGAPDFEVLSGYPYQVYVIASSTWPGGSKGIARQGTRNESVAETNASIISPPHLVCGHLRNSMDKIPKQISFAAYIVSNPEEVLTQDSRGCSYSNGAWVVQVASFSKPWKVGDILCVSFKDSETEEEKIIEVSLSSHAYDRVEGVRLTNIHSTDDNPTMVGEFALLQNYPNPFVENTQISYNLVEDGKVTLLIHNIAGQLVKTLVDEQRKIGNHSVNWDGTDDKGQKAQGGIYFCTIAAGNYRATKKVLLIK